MLVISDAILQEDSYNVHMQLFVFDIKCTYTVHACDSATN